MVAPNNTFYIKQGDTAPEIEEYLRNADGTAINLTGASGLEFHMMFGNGTVKTNAAATLVSGPLGRIKYSWVLADTDTAGTFYREWKATLASGKIVRTPNYTDYPVEITAKIA
jgi:hypothetical protein